MGKKPLLGQDKGSLTKVKAKAAHTIKGRQNILDFNQQATSSLFPGRRASDKCHNNEYCSAAANWCITHTFLAANTQPSPARG